MIRNTEKLHLIFGVIRKHVSDICKFLTVLVLKSFAFGSSKICGFSSLRSVDFSKCNNLNFAFLIEGNRC